jgi:hypothetical protein
MSRDKLQTKEASITRCLFVLDLSDFLVYHGVAFVPVLGADLSRREQRSYFAVCLQRVVGRIRHKVESNI